VDDCKNLPDYETLTLRIHHTPKLDFGNLQKRSCFIIFAARYRERFGELPSKTLLQSRQLRQRLN
jgi:hypothetical protein